MIHWAVKDVVADISGEAGLQRVGQFLTLRCSGATITEVSSKLGVCREHCSRSIKKKALLLLAEKFVALDRSCRRRVKAETTGQPLMRRVAPGHGAPTGGLTTSRNSPTIGVAWEERNPGFKRSS
jgi:hypothetical protein